MDVYDPLADLGSDAAGMDEYTKGRRLTSPDAGDEWPGTWEVWTGGASRLPAFRDAEGNVIRIFTNDRDATIKASIHHAPTLDKQAWGPVKVDKRATLHDDLVAFMEAHP